MLKPTKTIYHHKKYNCKILVKNKKILKQKSCLLKFLLFVFQENLKPKFQSKADKQLYELTLLQNVQC